MTPNSPRIRLLPLALDRLWHLASAPLTFVVLGTLLAGTLALAAIIPQQPMGLTSDAAANWTAVTTASQRTIGPFLAAIGAYTILNSLWMRLLLAALGFHLALRLVEHLSDTRRTLRAPQFEAPPANLPIAETLIAGALPDVLQRATERLQTDFPTLLTRHDTARAQVYGEQRAASRWTSVLICAGGLLVLTGLLADGVWGWHSSTVALAPGSSAAVSEQSPVRVAVQRIGGDERSPQAQITLHDGRRQRSQWLAFAWPARLGNLWAAQHATGLALTITAADATGAPLLLQELGAGGAVSETLHVLFQQTEGEQAIAIPAHNLALRAVAYPGPTDQDVGQAVILVEVFRGVELVPVASELIEAGATLTVDDITISLRRDRYAVLAVAYLPGLWLLGAGALLLLGGVIWRIGWGPACAWVDLAAERAQVGIAVRVATHADARGRAERLLAACTADTLPEASHAG